MLTMLTKQVSSSAYSARTWDFEDAYRYIFEIDGNALEAGFFVHYLSGAYVKSVIELPISFGCPIKCRHCASGAIPFTKQLSGKQIAEMYEFIQKDNDLLSRERILVTYSGIGEGALQKDNLKKASVAIFGMHAGTYFNLSTVGFDPDFIGYCEQFAKELPLNHIQVSYLHHDILKLSSVVPDAARLGFDFSKLVHAIKVTDSRHVRFNYVLIRDFNDSTSDWDCFMEKVDSVKEQVIVRVSRLNNTPISLSNGLCAVPEETMLGLRDRLLSHGYNAHIFFPENDNTMNCGQLSWDYRNVNR